MMHQISSSPFNNAVEKLASLLTEYEVETNFCSSYIGYEFERIVVLYGDEIPSNVEKIILQIKTDGEIICYDSCPEFIKNIVNEMSP